MGQAMESFPNGMDRAGRDIPLAGGCSLSETCLQSMVLSERIRALHSEMATIRSRLDRLETVLSRGMAVLLANLTGVVLMLAKQFLLK